ncbi:hypothetical protein KKP04_07020 [Rhodomicrobium sp. Az07]|uniref:hypothetical protein n=1 Tax=Rhodomicrobium sp. Az07 TaxID=2839034 RepID=UPI001BE6CBA1|nr:hypothetical protein [Rhodomicrobium sp. Az07]MBT3070615.1 hypothetical protein [Rhodomicrobium sp. Az07]
MAKTAKLLGASLLALTMTAGAAALAATDEAPANATPKTESKSYLPPWMQKNDRASASPATAAAPVAASGAGAVAAARAANTAPRQADAQRRRARPQPRSRQTRGPNVPFFRGVASIFKGFAR